MDINKLLEKAWPQWHIVRCIGDGSYGNVYEAEREPLYGRVGKAAIKAIEIPRDEAEIAAMHEAGMDDQAVRAHIDKTVSKLLSDIQILDTAKYAKGIVDVQDAVRVDREDGFGCTVLIREELLTSLRDYINKKDGLSKQEVIRLGKNIGVALKICGENNLIHRDIKPENIFMTADGHFKLGDFGIAESMSRIRPADAPNPYVAPEIRKKQPFDRTSDYYSLGAILHQFLDPQSDADKEVARVALRLCAPSPRARYQSMEEFLKDWNRCEQLENGSAGPVSPAQRGYISKAPVQRATQQAKSAEQSQPEQAAEEMTQPGQQPVHQPVQQPGRGYVAQTPVKEPAQQQPAEQPQQSQPGRGYIPQNQSEVSQRGYTEQASTEQQRGQTDYSGQPPVQPPVQPPTDDRKKSPLKAILLSLLVLILLAGAGGGAFYYYKNMTFKLEVRDGQGSGEYKAGETVSIIADEKEGKKFVSWLATGDVLTPEQEVQEIVSFVMPRSDVSVAATYESDSGKTLISEKNTEGQTEEATEVPVEVVEVVSEEVTEAPAVVVEVVTEEVTEAPAEKPTEKPTEKQTETEAARLKVGDRITFGSYEQDDDFNNGNEPIEWRVLDVSDTEALLISEYVLDGMAYVSSRRDATWENSDLRAWMNSSFYDEAFSIEDKECIVYSHIETPDNEYNLEPVDGGPDTWDYVFCLSIEEVKKYFHGEADQRGTRSVYARFKIKGSKQEKGTTYWWLRTPGRDNSCQTDIRLVGEIGYRGDFNDQPIGVRPAIRINLDEAERLGIIG